MPLARCGQLGSMAAAQVISQMGPRPAIALTTLLK
jgi:sugar/nucleoside kinase (ribokinase family)